MAADKQTRNELLSSSSSAAQPYSSTSTATRRNAPASPIHESPFAPNQSTFNGPTAREDFALREHTFLQESENSIDQYISQGRAVLENLVEQRGMLKGTKRRLLDTANTLGLSRETIGWVERRT
jgi:Golgi SNAP receptor complex protein 2